MTGSAVSIRRAAETDVPRLVELYRELDESHQLHHPELYSETITRERESIARMLFDAQGAIFVAEIEGGDSSVVAGFVRIVDVQSPGRGALRPRRFALVDDLVVDPAFRRSGLGTRLLQTAEAWARERGVEALEVTVWAFNQAAQDLYTIPRQDLRGPRKFLRPVRANGVGAPFAGCRGEALTVDTGEAGAACSCGASVARPVRSI